MKQLFLVPEHPGVDNLQALLQEERARRDVLRRRYKISQRKVEHLRLELLRLTKDQRRKNQVGRTARPAMKEDL